MLTGSTRHDAIPRTAQALTGRLHVLTILPLALRRTGASRTRWFDDYLRLSVERDAAELARIRQRKVLRQLLERLAGQTAQILNVAAASRGLEADRKTIDGYVRLLEDLFLVQTLPAWGTTLRARAAKLPKIHVVDSGRPVGSA